MDKKENDKKFYESIDLLSQEMAKIAVNNSRTKLLYEIEQDIVKGTKRKKYKKNSKDIINFSSDTDENDLNLSLDNSSIYNTSINNSSKNITNCKNLNNNSKKKKKSIFINKNANINYKNNIITKSNNESIIKSSYSNKENDILKNSNKKLKKVSFAPNKAVDNMNNNKNDIKNNENIINENNINDNIINDNNNKNDNNIINEDNQNENNVNPILKSDTINKNLENKLISILSKKKEKPKINYEQIKQYMEDNNILPHVNRRVNRSCNYIPKFNLKAELSKINKDKLQTILRNNRNSSTEEKFPNGTDNINYKDNNNKEISKSLFYNLMVKNKNNNKDKEDDKDNNILEEEPEIMINDMETESNINIEDDLKTRFSRNSSRKNTVSSFIVNSNFDSSLSTSNNNNKTINNSLLLNYYKNEENPKGNNFYEKQLKKQKYTEFKINKKRREKELKESMNYYSIPKINSFSNDLLIIRGNYIPLFKRAIELENERKAKILINQRLKENNFQIQNKSNLTKRNSKQISEFYYEQMEWRDRVDKKNEYLKNIMDQKERENDSEISNYEMKIDPKSEFIIRTKRQNDYYYPKNDSSISRNSTLVINYSANRLYKDYKIREKKLKKLKNELTPSFKPAINPPLPFYSSRTSRNNEINNDKSYLQKYKKSRYKSKNKEKSYKSRNIHDKNFIGKKNSTFSQNFTKKDNYFKSTNVDSKNTKTIIINSFEKNNSQLEKIKENSSIENSSSISVSHKNIKFINDGRNNSNASSNKNKNKSLNSIKKLNDNSINKNEENPINKSIKIKNEKESEFERNQNNISYREKSRIIAKPKKNSIFKPIKKPRKNLSTSNIATSSLFNKNKIAKHFYQNNNKQNRKSLVNKSSKDLLITNKFYEKKKVKIPEKPEVTKNPKINESKKEETKNIENSTIKKQSNNLNDFFSNKFSEFKNENENAIVNNSDLFENLNEQNIHVKDNKVEEKKEIVESYEKEEKSIKQLVKSFKFNSSGDDEEEQNEDIEENIEEEESSSQFVKENKSNEWINKLKEISKNEELKTEREKDEINRRKKNGASTTRAQTKRIDSDRERIKSKKNIINAEDKLYILNYRNSSSTANYHPFTFTAKDPIFYKFFVKQK